jgi:hypothetical protein
VSIKQEEGREKRDYNCVIINLSFSGDVWRARRSRGRQALLSSNKKRSRVSANIVESLRHAPCHFLMVIDRALLS